VVLLTAFAIRILWCADMSAVRTVIIDELGVFLAAGIGQIFVASLEYLVPVAIGGGPTVQRVGDVAVSAVWPVRLVVRNGALAVMILGNLDTDIRVFLFVVVLATYAADLILVAAGAARQLRVKRARRTAKRAKEERQI
jgi:nitrite reductase (NO-forming)